MNKIIEKEKIAVENMIYEVRGKQVMLDSDLARLYECRNGTKDVNKAVNRNIERFPVDFYFQLTKEEYKNILRFQNGTLKLKQGQYSKYLPYVFTESGVAMLSTVLKTSIASQMSITIMRAFVAMRHYMSGNLIEQKYINNQVFKNTEDIKSLQQSFQKFEEKKKINEIYFNGQIFDAYSKIQEIFNETKNKLIIIDAYADNTLLDIIKRLKVDVTIITKKDNLLTEQDIVKYNKQYHNLKVIYDNTFHDRYFILDNSIIYHCGASINRIGYKTFSINLISDLTVSNTLINKINTVLTSDKQKERE